MLIFHRTECCKSPNALFFKVLKVLSHGFLGLSASSYSFALNIALFKVILWLFPGGLSLRMLKKDSVPVALQAKALSQNLFYKSSPKIALRTKALQPNAIQPLSKSHPPKALRPIALQIKSFW